MPGKIALDDLRIRKVKLNDEGLEIQAESRAAEETDTVDRKQVVLRSKQQPLASFTDAHRTLQRIALRLISAPSEWTDVRFRGCSVNYEDSTDRMGAVVTLLVDLDEFPAPLVINTPHLRVEDDQDESGNPAMPRDMQRAVELLLDEAMRFLAGERAQLDMFAAGSMSAEHAVGSRH